MLWQMLLDWRYSKLKIVELLAFTATYIIFFTLTSNYEETWCFTAFVQCLCCLYYYASLASEHDSNPNSFYFVTVDGPSTSAACTLCNWWWFFWWWSIQFFLCKWFKSLLFKLFACLLSYWFQMWLAANLINLPSSAAFLTSSCWISLTLLYYGLGNQYSATPPTKTGQCLLSFVTKFVYSFV